MNSIIQLFLPPYTPLNIIIVLTGAFAWGALAGTIYKKVSERINPI